ncbi:DMT family transporter [Pedococcus sp. 2YAF34]|uniref:DMT family transporter n=1 Tax=Pedococcus sp. 2YAF34 TaxID=3233032 RepID=UPI003F977C67
MSRRHALSTPATFLMWRFGIGAAVLLLFRPGALFRLSRAEGRHGMVLGGALAAGFLLQTTGRQHTPAGLSGFLTGAAVVLTPVVAALVFEEHVGRTGWQAVARSTAGIAGIAESSTTPSLLGAALTLEGAACFAVHIAGLSQWSTAGNVFGLTVLSVSVAAALCFVTAIVRGVRFPPTPAAWTSVLYLGVVATCLALAVQAWAQSMLTATTTAGTMTMEPVFAAVIAVAAGERALGWLGWLGGLLVVAGMAVAELGPRACCDAATPTVGCC